MEIEMAETIFYTASQFPGGSYRVVPYKVGGTENLLMEATDNHLELDPSAVFFSGAATNQNFFAVTWNYADSKCELAAYGIQADAQLLPGPTMQVSADGVDDSHMPSLLCNKQFPDMVYAIFPDNSLVAYKLQGNALAQVGQAMTIPGWLGIDDSGYYLYAAKVDGVKISFDSWKFGKDGTVGQHVDSKALNLTDYGCTADSFYNWAIAITVPSGKVQSPFSQLSDVRDLIYFLGQSTDETMVSFSNLALFQVKDGKFGDAGGASLMTSVKIATTLSMAASTKFLYVYDGNQVMALKVETTPNVGASVLSSIFENFFGILMVDRESKHLCAFNEESSVFQINSDGSLTPIPYKTFMFIQASAAPIAGVVPVLLKN
jgi:hypothetical protein